jgi:tetratricopeptide (TPR) repeat protein
MRSHRPLLLASLALAAAGLQAAAAQEWAGRGRARGHVEDDKGKMIAGATVLLRLGEADIDPANPGPGPDPLITDQKGAWAILGLKGGTWTALITAEGYRGTYISVRINEFEPGGPVRTKLQPIPKEVIEAQAQAAAAEAAISEVSKLVDEGNAALAANKPAEARAAYEQVIAKVPAEHHPGLLRGVARAYFLEEQVDQAVATLQKALEIKPDDEETLRLMVDLLVAAKRDKEAEPYIARLPAGTKVEATTLLNMGIKRYNDRNMEEALGLFERAVAEHPEMGLPYYYRGLAHIGLGHTAEAKADFQKFLELEPNHAKAADAREFLKSM